MKQKLFLDKTEIFFSNFVKEFSKNHHLAIEKRGKYLEIYWKMENFMAETNKNQIFEQI